MSAIRALERMLAAGVPIADAIEIAKGFESDMADLAASLARDLTRDHKADSRKAKDAERKRLKRAAEKSAESKDVRGNPQTSADEADASRTCERAQVVTLTSSLRSEGNPPVSPNGLTAPKGSDKARGTHLPESWSPDEDGWRYAAEALGPNVDPARELDRFRDYWRAVPGAKGRKADWPATWRNWCRNAADRLPKPRTFHERPHADQRQAAREDSLRAHQSGAMAALNRRLGSVG